MRTICPTCSTKSATATPCPGCRSSTASASSPTASAWLTIDQAAARFNVPARRLRENWLATWASVFPAAAADVLTAPPAVVGERVGSGEETVGSSELGVGSPDEPVVGSSGSGEAAVGSGGLGVGSEENGTPPTSSPPPPLPTPHAPLPTHLLSAAKASLLRHLRYPDLSAEQFDFFLTICELRRLNPWAGQIYAKTEHDPATGLPRIVVCVGIEGLRLIADRTGCYGGSAKPVYVEWGPGDRALLGRPKIAEVTVRKLVGGAAGKILDVTREARWTEYYSDEPANPIVAQMPYASLARCAEAAALRAAFPGEVGGLYVPEEFADRPAARFGGE